MRLANVMDEIGTRLRSIPGLRVWDWPAGSISPPAAVVSYPDSYKPHTTYARGADTMTVPVVVLVGRADERSARDQLSEYVDGSGARSLIAVLESGSYTAFDTLTVSNIEFDVVRMGETDYLAALFACDIVGSGA